MAFQLPTLNILCNIWTYSPVPPTVPARITDEPCNLAWGKRVGTMSTGGTSSPGIIVCTMVLLMAKTADIRGAYSTTFKDLVEVPAGSGRFYYCEFADFVGYGFDNMHKAAHLVHCNPFKTPDV